MQVTPLQSPHLPKDNKSEYKISKDSYSNHKFCSVVMYRTVEPEDKQDQENKEADTLQISQVNTQKSTMITQNKSESKRKFLLHLNDDKFDDSQDSVKKRMSDTDFIWPAQEKPIEATPIEEPQPQQNMTSLTKPAEKEKVRIIGTPDYIAPEVIRGEATNDKSIDMWAIGVVLYELLVGERPFHAENDVEKTFDNIKDVKISYVPVVDDPLEEDGISKEADDLIRRMLAKRVKDRISFKEIKEHAFFKGIDFKAVNKQRPVYVPHEDDEDFERYANLDQFDENFESPSWEFVFDKYFPKEDLENETHKEEKGNVDDFDLDMTKFDMARIDLQHEQNQNIANDLRDKVKKMDGKIKACMEKIGRLNLINKNEMSYWLNKVQISISSECFPDKCLYT